MPALSKEKREHIIKVINSLPNENLELTNVFIHDYFNGIAVVRNNKLAGRQEDIKFLESVEPYTRERFLKEGKILSAMNHEHIPKLYDIVEYDDVLLFRSEHIEGYSLKEVMEAFRERKEKIPVNVATSIILKLMNALYYAHNSVIFNQKKRSIIHYDIKPSNIIISARDYKRKSRIDDKFICLVKQNKIEPYLIDFGISKFSSELRTHEGTLSYLSPGQLENKKGFPDWRTDMHQLLLVYYEILANKTPFSGIPKKSIIEQKLNRDFRINEKEDIPRAVKNFIEKGVKRNPARSFISEKEGINELSKIYSHEKRINSFKKYRWPVIIIMLSAFMIWFSFTLYNTWDYQVNSIDSLISKVEHSSDITAEELDIYLYKIQQRAFEKKYYEPLLRGEFRDKNTKNPLYPSHLDTKDHWILVEANDEDAGIFSGLLFYYSDKYPGLLEYAKEYAEPVLNSEFDGTNPNRFHYALIEGYKKTKDERYMRKLVNISETLIYDFEARKGMTQSADLSLEPLFMFVYGITSDKRYLEFFDSYLKQFIKNNIDDDGFIYEFATVNATSIYGAIPDDKMERIVFATDTMEIGTFLLLSTTDIETFKNITSLFSREFVETLMILKEMYRLTNDSSYSEAFDRAIKYYDEKNPEDNIDYLFISAHNEENNIPKDSLAAVKALILFKETDNKLYYKKLKALLSLKYFRDEKERGILSGSIVIDNMNYAHSDEQKKNQTIIETDALFLKIKKN